jgi:glycosyltransferase involved in cell wall biosynthesis
MYATLSNYITFDEKEHFSELNELIIQDERFSHFINKPTSSNSIKMYTLFSIDKMPHVSIIMPIYNQEQIIANHINSIFKYTKGHAYELLLILDSCSDASEEKVRTFLSTYNLEKTECVSVRMFVSKIPLFETSCDNLGLYYARGSYAIEIQADMEMTESGYNMTLLKPFSHDDSIIGISGRCCHSFVTEEGIGKLGKLIEQPLSKEIRRDVYYIGETCNRGPLALDLNKVKELGYLDEVNFFLDNSEHDLFARAFYHKKYICGYAPMEMKTSLENGSTRKTRDPLNQEIYNQKKNIESKQNGFLFWYKKNHSPLPIRMVEY